ncbi:hypothetical protein [Fretibacter rubidus]|uniref:hypothetical protein n=1 Tax=Fretibacter rubidus TaxID=570162 RepID=UPI00352BA2A9
MSDHTKLEDMSETERQSWATLIVDVCVFIWFLKQTTTHIGSLALREMSASDLFGVYVGLIIVTVILHAIIAAVFETRKRKDHTTAKDERDIEIERRGSANGFWVLTIAVNIIIFTLLFEHASAQGADVLAGYAPPFSVLAPPAMFFALMAVIFIGDIVKNATMVLAYRGP